MDVSVHVFYGFWLLSYILGKNQILTSSSKFLDFFVSSSDLVFVDFLFSILAHIRSTNWVNIVRSYINFTFY